MGRLYDILDRMTDRTKPVTTTASISATTGSLVSVSAQKIGDMCILAVTAKNTASVPTGSNTFAGTLNTTALRPAATATAVSIYGSNTIVGMLWPDGTINFRNTGSATPTSAGLTETFIYIVGGGVRALKSLAACFSVGRRCVA